MGGQAKRAARRARASLLAAMIALATVASPDLGAAGGYEAERTALREALELALLTSPELAAQYQALRGLDEGVAQARGQFRPTIGASLSVGRTFTDSSEAQKQRSFRNPVSASLSASQPLFDGFQSHYAIEGALASVESGRFTLFQIEQTVLLNAITAYVQILTAEQNVRLARNNVEVIGRQLQAARDRFEVGEVTRTDVAQAEAALAESRANLATQEGTLRQAAEAYRRFVGEPPGKLQKLPPLPELPGSLDEARDIAQQRRPSILAAQSNVEVARAGVSEAEGALLPQVDLSASMTGASAQSSRTDGRFTAQAGVEVTVPIYSGGVLRSRVRQNKALEHQRFQQLRDTARQVNQEVGDAWAQLRTSRETTAGNLARVEAQRVAFEGVQEEAKVGSRTTLDVLEAEQELLNARVALVTSRANEQIAAYTLLSAIGVLNIETLELAIEREDPALYHGWAQGFVGHEVEVGGTLDDDWMNNWRP